MTEQGNERPGRRFLIAVAVAHFGRDSSLDLPGLADGRDEIVRLFTKRLGYELVIGRTLDPSRRELEDHLANFCSSSDLTPDDTVALYIGTHGYPGDGPAGHRLLLQDTDPERLIETTLPTARLSELLLQNGRLHNLLLMLDCCYAARGGNEVVASAMAEINLAGLMDQQDRSLVVMNSARVGDLARPGRFPALLRQVVEERATAGHVPAHLDIGTLVEQMNRKVAPHEQNCKAFGDLSGTRFFLNPRFDPEKTGLDLHMERVLVRRRQLKLLDRDYQQILLPKAKASPESDGGWWFEGRQNALHDIGDWLRTPSPERPLLTVTADPGSGKSALLGVVASVTDEKRRRAVPLSRLGLTERTFPLGCVDTVIYARNRQTGQILDDLATAAGVEAKTPGGFLESIRGRKTPLTVIIDALDEAADPADLCESLLSVLLERAEGSLRLLIGTRPHLLPLLGLRRPGTTGVIDLDSRTYADFEALQTYAMHCLRDSSADGPYRPGSEVPADTVLSVAQAIAEAAHPSFLVARMTSFRLASEERAVPDPHDPRWRAELPRKAGDAMDEDLRRLGEGRRRAEDLLRPLAFHEGEGLPFEDIWPSLATELSGRPYRDEDVHWLIEAAGSYVVETLAEGGGSVYRLYHEALGEWLREQTALETAAVHRGFAKVLLSRVRVGASGVRDWAGASAYSRRFLARHAARGGAVPSGGGPVPPRTAQQRLKSERLTRRTPPGPSGTPLLEELLDDPEFLVHADPVTLLPLVGPERLSAPLLRRRARVYRSAVSRLRSSDALMRRQLLAFIAAQHGMNDLVNRLSTPPSEPPLLLRPRWATGGEGRPGHGGTILDMDTVRLGTGDALVTCSHDATVRVWDMRSGRLLRVLSGPLDRLDRVSCGYVNGQPVIAASGEGFEIWVWDAEDGLPLAVLTGHSDEIREIQIGSLGPDQPVLISVSADCTGIVWDLQRGAELHTLIGHTDEVRSIGICPKVPGIGVTASWDGTARCWDLTSGVTLHELVGLDGPAQWARCSVTLRGEHLALITGEMDGEIWVWDLQSGAGRPLPKRFPAEQFMHTSPFTREGALMTLTADSGGEAILWDLERAEIVREMAGHRRVEFDYAAAGTLGGRDIGVGSGAPEAALWDLATGRCLGGLAFPEDVFLRYLRGPQALVGVTDQDIFVVDPGWRGENDG